jgi:hypothetical protein
MNVPEQNLVSAINDSLGIELKKDLSADQLADILSEHINDLIDRNFNKLVNLLYRIDVNESKLRQMLNENSNDAGRVIAGLIIERQLQKIASRESFRNSNENSIDEKEKW